MVHRQPVTVRYAETDQMGVVHHAAYLVYLEEARAGLLAAAGNPYKEFEDAGVGLPVRRVDVRYRASARYGDELVVHVHVIALRAASVTFEHRIERVADGLEILRAEVEMACFDMESRRARRFPERLCEIFRAAMPSELTAEEASCGEPTVNGRTEAAQATGEQRAENGRPVAVNEPVSGDAASGVRR